MNDVQAQTSRDALRALFLDRAGQANAPVRPLAGDASNRRYFRLPGAVLMDAPPERGEDVRPFVAVTAWLRDRGLSAPEIYVADEETGFLLLEDLGDALFAQIALAHPGSEPELYASAVDLLAQMHAAGPAGAAFPPYDAATLHREAMLALDWWYWAATGTEASPDVAAAYTAEIGRSLADLPDSREAVVLRDFHAENLIWLPERAGAARVGLLDYQDALIGHPAYDLVSLLEDARRDTSPDLQQAMIGRYVERAELGRDDTEAFRAAYAALGAQRNLKIVGIFARLALRDGRPRYLAMIPRVWSHLQRDLSHPALGDLARWVEAHLPVPESTTLGRVAARAEARLQQAGAG